ncbi:hypothetical protein [Mesorhizobium sp. B2-6-2]|uniref:hypothetical protein n=1 Tax=Mesorhizobium sp. B2-6-2 TaxID=2589915 RepID=UPI001FF0037F|nr:hypothetical protein [Mesorhizobium sp. B2-6-2]
MRIADDVHDGLACLHVEASCRLVGKKKLRTVGKRPRNCKALAFAAGKLGRPQRSAIGKTEIRQKFQRASATLVRSAEVSQQSHLDVLARRQGGEQAEVLEDDADPAGPDRCPRSASIDGPSFEPNFAAGRPVEPADKVQDRRFPAAAAADNRDGLVIPDCERHVVNGDDAAAVKIAADIAQFDEGGHERRRGVIPGLS